MWTDQAKCLNELERESGRLRKVVADLSLDIEILKIEQVRKVLGYLSGVIAM